MPQQGQNRPRFIAEFLKAVWSDLPLYALVGLFVLFGLVHSLGAGYSVLSTLQTYLVKWAASFGILGPFFALTIGVTHITLRMKGRKRLAYRTMIEPRRLGRLASGTVFMVTAGLLFTTVFSSMKATFPMGRDFPFDILHAEIDRMLHFGIDPFHYLYGFAKHEWVLRIIELNYNVVWFAVAYFSLYFVMTSPRTGAVRLRFAATWLSSWLVVGIAMASQWLSAGPIYYGRVTGDVARFAEQNAFLSLNADLPGSASSFQEYLWFLHTSGHAGVGSGISAFPSMHVALVVVVALFASEYSRRLGALAWAYFALIQFSSVYLGWHYAIDGYASLVTVVALYWALRKLMPVLPRLRWFGPVATPQPDPVYVRNN